MRAETQTHQETSCQGSLRPEHAGDEEIQKNATKRDKTMTVIVF